MNIDKIKQAFMEGYMEITAFPNNARTSNCSPDYKLIEDGAAITAGELVAAKRLGPRIARIENNYAAKRLLGMQDKYEEIKCSIDSLENEMKKINYGGILLMHPLLRAKLEKKKIAYFLDGKYCAFGKPIFPVGTIGEDTIIALPDGLPYLDYSEEDIFETDIFETKQLKEQYLVVKRHMNIIYPESDKFVVLRVGA